VQNDFCNNIGHNRSFMPFRLSELMGSIIVELLRGHAEIPIIATCSGHAVGGFMRIYPHSRLHHESATPWRPAGNLKLSRRNFASLAAGAAALPVVSRIARAQTYPARPVRIVVGFAAGGINDILARLIGQWLSDRLGQQFVIENRTGAGGNIGTEMVARAPPDGYTLLLVPTAAAINAALYDKLNFVFLRDIAPLAGIMRGSNVIVVNPSVPTKSVPEFIAYVKANPGKISMASPGIGTGPHVAGELFKMMAGVDMVHVPIVARRPP
jgi:tripartite-type tricarboxylate transporter receptor subunit TctC